MLKHLDRLVDRSCWISADRINACLGVDAHGITEVGFHGLQPVSRNSRMLVREQGVLVLSVRESGGREERIPFHTVDWQPHRVSVDFSLWERVMRLEVTATVRAILITVTGDVAGCLLAATFFPDACTTQVRGERTWEPPVPGAHWLTLRSRDSIRLYDWVRQEGPYAGDFLIPEPWRRTLFGRHIRSGQATAGDLRPEYRDADVPLYDALTTIRIGGRCCTVEPGGDRILFLVPLESSVDRHPVLVIEGSEDPGSLSVDSRVDPHPAVQAEREAVRPASPAPRLVCSAAPEVEEWIAAVPAIVRSCTVTDVGMPRATPGAYYWLWAWDAMVTGMEVMRWGDYASAAAIARFINTHRDMDGSIPARWTRSGLPLDTPPRGALEFLLLHLAYQHARESADRGVLIDVYPYAVAHLRDAAERSGGSGYLPTMGFYPDLPLAFGRTPRSIVAMETGCLYGFARILENAALWMGDAGTREAARLLAGRIEAEFLNRFWDSARGFLVDAVDADTRERNVSYPLFSLLFLQTPLGLAPLRRVLPELSRFMQDHLQTDDGTRVLPSWDPRTGSEEVSSSWYPHWDLYLVKVLRRTGAREGIHRWLRAAEQCLRLLGYVPEFLRLDGLSAAVPESWRRHGAVSNLNCVTAWHHCVLEGLAGIDVDPGGMCVVPLDLALGPLHVQGMVYQGTRWDVRVESGGPSVEELRVDGTPLRGVLKIPSAWQDGRPHELVVRYGRSTPGPRFREVLNAEVLDSVGDARSCAVRLHALGTAEIMVDDPEAVHCECDGRPFGLAVDPHGGVGTGRIHEEGIHTLTLVARG